jgi:hypothetical protein
MRNALKFFVNTKILRALHQLRYYHTHINEGSIEFPTVRSHLEIVGARWVT